MKYFNNAHNTIRNFCARCHLRPRGAAFYDFGASAIMLMGLLSMMSFAVSAHEGAVKLGEVSTSGEWLAGYISQIPDKRMEQLKYWHQQGTLSSYEYQAEVQRIKHLRSLCDRTAWDIHQNAEWEGWNLCGRWLADQAGAALIGKYAGKVAGRFVDSSTVAGDVIPAAIEALINNLWTLEGGFADRGAPPDWNEEYLKAKKEVDAVLGMGYDDLMRAKLHHVILGLRAQCTHNPSAYDDYLDKQAKYYDKIFTLSRAAMDDKEIPESHRRETPWKDTAAFKSWLATQAKCPKADKKDEGKKEISELSLSNKDFFIEQDFNTLRSSTPLVQEKKYISQPPSDDFGPGAIADLSYGGFSDKAEDITALVGIIAYQKAEQAEYIFNGMKEKTSADVLAHNKDLHRDEEKTTIQASSYAFTMSRPSWKFSGEYYPRYGALLRYRLHSNTFIMIQVSYTTPSEKQTAVEILDGLDSSAMDVIDDALERCGSQPTVPIT